MSELQKKAVKPKTRVEAAAMAITKVVGIPGEWSSWMPEARAAIRAADRWDKSCGVRRYYYGLARDYGFEKRPATGRRVK